MNAYGLIGYPLSHSFSPAFFRSKFEKENISAQYKAYPLSSLTELTELINSEKLLGFNVTIPYKEEVLLNLNELDEIAKNVGAVNCVKVTWENNSASLKGYNTDVYGFSQSIKPFLESQHNKALVLGTGGGAKAVTYALKQLGVECYLVSREKKEGVTFTYADLNNHVLNACKLIVNTTPVGMFPNIDSSPILPYELLNEQHFLYDLIYNPEETLFIQKGKTQGSLTMNGYDMLKLQAEKSWEIWTISS